MSSVLPSDDVFSNNVEILITSRNSFRIQGPLKIDAARNVAGNDSVLVDGGGERRQTRVSQESSDDHALLLQAVINRREILGLLVGILLSPVLQQRVHKLILHRCGVVW